MVQIPLLVIFWMGLLSLCMDQFVKGRYFVHIDVIKLICKYYISDECYSNPSQNGGTCIDEKLMFTCECPKYFGGRTCEIGWYWQFAAEKIVTF